MSLLSKSVRQMFRSKPKPLPAATQASAGQPSADLLYFLHVPKTSGTSLYKFLLDNIGVEHALPPALWDQFVSGELVITDDTRLISGHMHGLMPLWIGRWPKIVTMLRDPIARAVSHINHVHRDPSHPLHDKAKGLSIEAYCEHPQLRMTVDNLQSRHLASLAISAALLPKQQSSGSRASIAVKVENTLFALDTATGMRAAAIETLDTIDAFGICEFHGASLQLIARQLGWDGSANEANLNRASASQTTIAELAASELEALTQLNEIDLALYDYGCQKFNHLCAKAGIPLNSTLRKTA